MKSPTLRSRALLGAATISLSLGLILAVPDAASAATAQISTQVSAPSLVRTVVALPVLRRGSTGYYVTRVQIVLGVRVTGYYGPLTEAAVKRFQQCYRVTPADGVVRASTWLTLNRWYAAKAARLRAIANDATMTTLAKTSSAARLAVSLKVWQASPHGQMIATRESHGSCTSVSSGGAYRGKWQLSASLWKGYGGLVFAATADRATCAEQDLDAYRAWLRSWWWPWGG